jgi:DNA-directed RNA polymerase specialized sigma24 family protein
MAIARQKTRQRELREARALIRRVQRGDRRAFELLYSAYEGRVYRFCHRLTGDDRTAAALVELTFARALADIPEDGFDTLDVPAYLLGTARSLAYERSGELAAAPGQWEGEVAPANQRLSPQERAVLVLRDLEGRPDDEIARVLGAQEQAVPGLVGTARLRLYGELRLPEIGAPCPGRLPALSAYADDTLAAEERDELARHVTGCANCRAALFALRESALRYRTLPVPEPPGDLGSRISTALGAVGLPARAIAAAEPVAGGGRKTAVAVAMGALALVGVGVTIAAAGDDDGAAKPASAPVSPQPQAQPSAPVSDPAVAIGAVSVPVTGPRRPPPVLHHQRAGTHRRAHAHAPAQRAARPTVAQQLGLGKSFAPEGPPVVASPPAPTPVTTPKPKPTPVHDIPVDVLPPNPPPTAAQAASQTSPDPPPQPEAPPPGQTTST